MKQEEERGGPVSFVDLVAAAHKKKGSTTLNPRAQRHLQDVNSRISEEVSQRSQSATSDNQTSSADVQLSTDEVNRLYLEVYLIFLFIILSFKLK